VDRSHSKIFATALTLRLRSLLTILRITHAIAIILFLVLRPASAA
jgi:cystathionine beta-lyase family protein involved in aluminum resistance